MRSLFVFAVLIVAVAAETPILDKDLSDAVNGGLKSTLGDATLLQRSANTLMVQEPNPPTIDGDATNIRPMLDIKPDEPNECSQCDPLSQNINEKGEGSISQLSEQQEDDELTKQIKAIQQRITETQECADDLENRKNKVQELKDRWSLLDDTEKREILRNKLIVEESSIAHVHQMTEILARKVSELKKAKVGIEEKTALTKTAIEELDKMEAAAPAAEGAAPAAIVANATDQLIDTTLKAQLDGLHTAMKSSLEKSNQHIFDLTAKVPGLHDLSFWSNMTHKAGGKNIADMISALQDPARADNFKKFIEEHNVRVGANSAIDDEVAARVAKKAAENEGLIELQSLKSKLQKAEHAEELKATIRKLKKKLKRKRKTDF